MRSRSLVHSGSGTARRSSQCGAMGLPAFLRPHHLPDHFRIRRRGQVSTSIIRTYAIPKEIY
jgi:hypothetical protein